jgi:HEPN domain-containing protein
MPEAEAVGLVARDWIAKADGDLRAARHLLESQGAEPWIVTFHAQQAAEKYLKAALVAEQVPFPPTHDLELLRQKLTTTWALPDAAELARLTTYAVAGRYPHGLLEVGPDPDWADATTAVQQADTVASAVVSGMEARGIMPTSEDSGETEPSPAQP